MPLISTCKEDYDSFNEELTNAYNEIYNLQQEKIDSVSEADKQYPYGTDKEANVIYHEIELAYEMFNFLMIFMKTSFIGKDSINSDDSWNCDGIQPAAYAHYKFGKKGNEYTTLKIGKGFEEIYPNQIARMTGSLQDFKDNRGYHKMVDIFRVDDVKEVDEIKFINNVAYNSLFGNQFKKFIQAILDHVNKRTIPILKAANEGNKNIQQVTKEQIKLLDAEGNHGVYLRPPKDGAIKSALKLFDNFIST